VAKDALKSFHVFSTPTFNAAEQNNFVPEFTNFNHD